MTGHTIAGRVAFYALLSLPLAALAYVLVRRTRRAQPQTLLGVVHPLGK